MIGSLYFRMRPLIGLRDQLGSDVAERSSDLREQVRKGSGSRQEGNRERSADERYKRVMVLSADDVPEENDGKERNGNLADVRCDMSHD
jgi:hypothetical protein